MTSSDGNLIAYFDVRVPVDPDAVDVCTPASGAVVPPAFHAKGKLVSPDTDLDTCNVEFPAGNKSMDSHTLTPVTATITNWDATFTGVNTTATPVRLRATGNGGGMSCIMITVSATAP